MEAAPLIMAAFSLILSLTLTGITIKGQANHFQLLSWQENRYDCEDTVNIISGTKDLAITPFDEMSVDCLIPHLHELGPGKESPLPELFRGLTEYCASGGCQ